MGTRALVYVMDENCKKPLTRVHVQYDGYPDGIMLDALIRIGEGRVLVNGYRDPAKEINGMENFAVMLLWALMDARVEWALRSESLRKYFKGKRLPPAGDFYVSWDSDDFYDYTYVFYPKWEKGESEKGNRPVDAKGVVMVRVYRGYARDPLNEKELPVIFEGTMDEYIDKFGRGIEQGQSIEDIKLLIDDITKAIEKLQKFIEEYSKESKQ